MESLRVALGNRAYPIHIGAGILRDAGLYGQHRGGAVVVTNTVVAPLYLAAVKKASGANAEVVVPDGEEAKDWRGLQQVIDGLMAAKLGRDGLVVALGGGVVGDLAGFAAAVYQRGVAFVQVPTTLLAQVDSSVGGKTAINHPLGKNMIGAFHQPVAVIADMATLDTLPDRELRAGIAEVIKHGAALDAPFFEWLERNIENLLKKDPKALIYAVRRSCELKAAVVAADEREAGERALLNFGHTFGHAIEAVAVEVPSGTVTTLTVRADRLVVRQDAEGFQITTATGAPVRFRQRQDPKDGKEGAWMDGESLRMEIDDRKSTIELFDKARVTRDGDEVTGEYIFVDQRSDYFSVSSGKKESGRVKAVIQPKASDEAPK